MVSRSTSEMSIGSVAIASASVSRRRGATNLRDARGESLKNRSIARRMPVNSRLKLGCRRVISDRPLAFSALECVRCLRHLTTCYPVCI